MTTEKDIGFVMKEATHVETSPGTETDRANMWQRECARILEILQDDRVVADIAEKYPVISNMPISMRRELINTYRSRVIKKLNEDSQ